MHGVTMKFTLSLCSSLRVSYQLSRPFNTHSAPNDSKYSLTSICFQFLLNWPLLANINHLFKCWRRVSMAFVPRATILWANFVSLRKDSS